METTKTKQLNVFDLISEKYISSYGENPKIAESTNWLIQNLEKGSHVLDIGCGTAKLTATELINANYKFTGIDSSIKMLEEAKKINPKGEFIHMDFSKLNLQNKYNAITAYFSLLMLPKSKIESTIRTCVELLNPNGYLIIAMIQGDFDYIEIPFFDQKINVSAYNTNELEKVLKNSSLKIIRKEEVEYNPENGAPLEVQQFFYCQKN